MTEFTVEDIRQIEPGISDEEVQAAFHIFEHMGLIRKIVKNGKVCYERTGKEPPGVKA